MQSPGGSGPEAKGAAAPQSMRDRLAGALPPGRRLMEYEIQQVLGRPGGFGITYLALDLNLQKKIAIKEFLPADIAWRQDGIVVPRTPDDREAFDWGRRGFINEARVL